MKFWGSTKREPLLTIPNPTGWLKDQTLATQLSMFVNENHSDWDEHLPTVLMAYRTAVQESTGQTPARLMMGHELRVPLDLMFGQPPGSSLEVQKAWN